MNVVLHCTAVVCSGARLYTLWSVGANHLTRKTYGTVRIGAMFEENHTEIIFATKVVFTSKYGTMLMINCLDK